MRRRLNYRHLQVICVGFIGVAIGLLAGSHLGRSPANDHPPLHGTRDVEDALNSVIPEIDLEATPFNEAVERVRKLSPVPIAVNWKELSAAAIDGTAPVTFRARDATLGRVLSELVHAVETPQAGVGYAPAGNVILISTSADADRLAIVVRAYDVQDLLRPAGAWDLEIPEPIILGGTIMGGPGPPGPRPLREERLERLVQDWVASDSWVAYGGPIGSIRFLAGKMIVIQTFENQRQIASLLAQLRETPPPSAPPPTPDLTLWDDTLKKYVSANPSVGEAALSRHIPEVRLDRVPLDQAVTTLADLAHADLIVGWHAFELAKVNERTPVSVWLHDATLAEALRALLDSAGAGPLDVQVNGGFVILGLGTGNTFEPTTRIYDIRDWLAAVMGPPPAPAPKGPDDLKNWQALQDEHVDRLIRVIQETIAPDSWTNMGGSIGAIRDLNRQLIVTQTWDNQERVADLIAAIRTDPSHAQTWENQERVADLLAALRADPSRLQLPTTAPATRP